MYTVENAIVLVLRARFFRENPGDQLTLVSPPRSEASAAISSLDGVSTSNFARYKVNLTSNVPARVRKS